jgi:methylglutaconyl-CoA hydratase
MWRPADWARKRGLFAELHPDVEGMDESVNRLANALLHSDPEAMSALKKIIWKGTDNWDELLQERAAISGALVVSPAAKAALAKL